MSEFCLLAAQLLSQRQLPGWKLAASASPPAAIGAKPCSATKGMPKGTPAVQPPESSSQQFSSGVADDHRSVVDRRPTASTERSIQPPQPPIQPPKTPIRWAQPGHFYDAAGYRPSPLPGLDATGQAYLPFSAPASLRPATGSQLYQQRVIALRSGRLYTRLAASSYQNAWLSVTTQPTHEQWVRLLAAEAGSIARGQGSNRLTVMVGDSLYLWYPQEQLSSDRFWLNQGISGDTTAGVLRRLSAFAQTRPDRIQVMVGINDLRRGATDDQVLNNLRQIMRQLRHAHPHAQIFVQSILPTRLAAIPAHRIWRINDRLAQITQQEGVDFVDLQQYFADASGSLRDDLTTDGLHLNPQGYAMWQTALHEANPAL